MIFQNMLGQIRKCGHRRPRELTKILMKSVTFHWVTYYPTCKGKVRSFRTSGKFGHTFANSGNPDETAPYEPSHHQDFHCLLS